MLWHIRPRLFSPFKHVTLIDLKIDPLGLFLIGGKDLVARRPYPNRHYAVACRKDGRKAIDGILIETEKPDSELLVTARWAIEAELSVTHEVRYALLDRDFDAASDHMTLWRACVWDLKQQPWSSRWPDRLKGVPPVRAEPVMDVLPGRVRSSEPEDLLDDTGEWIMRRRERFAMPTLERERIVTCWPNDRMPPLSSAFRI
jgi:hypothetical protein